MTTLPDRPAHTYIVSRLLPALLLGGIGFVGNWFRFPLFFNVDLLFGSIFVMLALQFCGLIPALPAALAAGSATWLIWNHPYAMIIFFIELFVTGLLYKRWHGNLMLANTAYWLTIGMPLVYLFYAVVMQIGADGTFAIMFKQAINGISNVIIARLLAIAVASYKQFRLYLQFSPSFRERIITLLGMFVMSSSMILLALVSRRDVVRAENQIVTLLSTARRQTEGMLVTNCTGHQCEEMKEHLIMHIHANRVLERLSYTLYAPDGTVMASSRQPYVKMPDKSSHIRQMSENVSCVIPKMRNNISIMERWKRSAYMTTLSTPAGLLVIQTSMAPWLSLLYSNSIQFLLTVLLLFLASMIPGIWISNRICQSLQLLGETGSGIPDCIAKGKQPDWPDSGIPEVARLTEELRLMTDSLVTALEEKQVSLKQLQIAAERQNELELLMVSQREHERLRISRELHDDIGQSLQAIKLNIQLQLASCNSRVCPGMELMQELINSLEQTVSTLRGVVSSLRQSPEANLSLPEALHSIAEKLCYNKSIMFSLRVPTEEKALTGLSDSTRDTLYFIAQEAIANAARHSKASTLRIILHVKKGCIRLIVADNGKGGASSVAGGSGIAIMRERAVIAGGTMKLESAANKGTTILVEVPFS